MRIEFVRTGGFAGLRMATTIDIDSLPPEEAQEIQDALEEAHFFNLPPELNDIDINRGVDRFQYEITVEDGGQKHTIQAGETALPEHLQPLVKKLEWLARTHRR